MEIIIAIVVILGGIAYFYNRKPTVKPGEWPFPAPTVKPTEEVKVEEIKIEEVKVEEVKAEEVKAEEVKPEEVKAEEVKAE